MNWEDIGMMVGYNLAGGYFKNQHDRWVDEGRKALKDMANVNDADRKKAQGLMGGLLGGDSLIGQDPQLLLLKNKRDYMQAANDKQYLLNNGYAEDAEEVQSFDKKMAAAHTRADALRQYAKSAGIHFGGIGDGMDLQQLHREVNRREYPALYDENRYALLRNAPSEPKLWSDMSAGYVLGKTDTPPTFGVPGETAPQSAAAPQALGVPGLSKPAAELSSEELMQMLTGQPNFKADPFGIRGVGANPGNACSPGTGNALVNQGMQGMSARDTANISQSAQAGAGGAQTADASIDMRKTANAPMNAPAANDGYSEREPSNRITAKSIYKYLQSIGEIDKKVDYDAAIDELAKSFAEERVKRMTDEEKRDYLLSQGVGRDIASIVIPEANAKAREKARQEAMAKMAASATNPMMAEALAMMALTDGAKPGDFMDAIRSTRPEMGFHDTDLGGTKIQTMYDKNGWLNPQAAQFVKTVSPDALLTNQTRYDTTKMQQENANWRAQYKYLNGGSGGRGASSGKVSEAEKKLSDQFANQFNTVLELYNKSGEVAHDDMADAVDRFTQSVLDGINDGSINGDDATYLLNKAYLAQLVYAAKFGEKGAAREIWSNFSDDYLYDTDSPDYAILNNIYQWLNSDIPDAAEKAHVQNMLSEPEKEYRPKYDEAILNVGDPTLR